MPMAQYEIRTSYLKGRGVAKDNDLSWEWRQKAVVSYTKLAKKGNAYAQARLVEIHGDYNKKGKKKWSKKLSQSYPKFLEQGDAEEQYKLGKFYRKRKLERDSSDEIQQDLGKAFELFSKAAEQGNIQAQYELASMYRYGKGTQQDYAKAFESYQKVVNDVNVEFLDEVKNALGEMYEEGKGTEQNYAKAIEWYRKAADSGNTQASYNLGNLYENGKGIKQDYAKAAKWYHKATEKNSDARYRLGVLYEKGKGVKQNDLEAAYWYTNISGKWNEDAKYALMRLTSQKGNDVRMSQTNYNTGEQVSILVEKILPVKGGMITAISVTINGKKIDVLGRTFKNMKGMLRFATNK